MSVDLDVLKGQVTLRNALIVGCGVAIFKLRHYLYWPIYSMQSPLGHLAGPENENFFLGHMIKIFNEQSGTLFEDWLEKYGKTFRYRGFFGSYQLFTTDARAIHSVLSHPTAFPKSEAARRGLAILIGNGLVSADPEAHKRQRRIMNPSFGSSQIRELVPVFCEKSNQLRDIWLGQFDNQSQGATIDVLSWLTKTTLDIIGSAGFGYEFNSLTDGDEDLLAKAFTRIFDNNRDITVSAAAKGFICGLLRISTAERRAFDGNLETIRRIGTKIVQDKKTMLSQESKDSTASAGRDLLTLLIKSNMALETAGENATQMMSDDEVLGQISTFLVAGHETTSVATTWALYALTEHPQVQSKLRQELMNAGLGDEPTMGELDKLSFLDAVVKEAMRMYAPIPNVGREAAFDIAIPVGEEYKDRKGVVQTEIRIQKGDNIMIPILPVNRAKETWGEDAMEFKPERWENLPDSVKEVPGVWGHQMTFIEGIHACIGYRFAVIEIKALLYSLIRSIEFEIDPTIEIEGKTFLATRPCVKSEPKKGSQMPLICKPVKL